MLKSIFCKCKDTFLDSFGAKILRCDSTLSKYVNQSEAILSFKFSKTVKKNSKVLQNESKRSHSRIVLNCTKKIKKSSEWFEILTTFEQKSIMCKLELVLDWHNGLISLVAQRRTTVHSRLNLGLVIKSDFFGWFVFGSSHLLILFLYNLFHIYCSRCKTSKRVFRSSNWPDLTIWWDSEARKIYFILLYTRMCSRLWLLGQS